VLRDGSEEFGEAAAVVGGMPLKLLVEVLVERWRRHGAVFAASWPTALRVAEAVVKPVPAVAPITFTTSETGQNMPG